MLLPTWRVRVLTNPRIRRAIYRWGRSAYSQARLDLPNAMSTNGEQDIQAVVVAHAVSGDVVFDVGANKGEWSMALLQAAEVAGVDVEIHAFEPVPSTSTVLARQLSKSVKEGKVKIHRQALSDEKGTATMHAEPFDTGRSGTNSLLKQDATEGAQEITVDVVTLDSEAAELEVDRLLLVKCDTEGNDLNVICGALHLLAQEKLMVMQFEYNWRWVAAHAVLRDVFDLVGDFGYQVGKVLPGGIEIYPTWHPELERYFEANYVLLHRDAVPWFNTWLCSFDGSNRPVLSPTK